MNPHEAQALALLVCVACRVPVILWGTPGIGKSRTVEAVARALSILLETVIASVREPSDFAGLPVVVGGDVRLAPPAWARRLAEAGGLLFLDEVSTAAPSTQAALLRVVDERVVGELTLPDTVAVVAAANPVQQAAGGWDLSAAAANRWCHLTWRAKPVQDWSEELVHGWESPAIPSLPKGWESSKHASQGKLLVAAFCRARPSLYDPDPPEDLDAAGRAWPSPRTWDRAAKLLGAVLALGHEPTGQLALTLVTGCVGDGAAIEAVSYWRDLDLPDPATVLTDPKSWVVGQRGDRVYAALSAVAAFVIASTKAEHWNGWWDVCARAKDAGFADVAAACSKPIAKAWPKLAPPGTSAAGCKIVGKILEQADKAQRRAS